jgi:hypothetical protein
MAALAHLCAHGISAFMHFIAGIIPRPGNVPVGAKHRFLQVIPPPEKHLIDRFG